MSQLTIERECSKKIIGNRENDNIKRFTSIFERYSQKIYNYVYRMIGNEWDTEDLTQEIFIKIFKNLSNFRGDSSLSTWIYRIANNTCINYYRKPKREHYFNVVGDEMNEGKNLFNYILPDEMCEQMEIQKCMHQFINLLPPDYRTVIILHDLQGIKNQEIANILECSLETVKIRLHRAKRKLRDLLCSKCFFFNPLNPCNCGGRDWRGKNEMFRI